MEGHNADQAYAPKASVYSDRMGPRWVEAQNMHDATCAPGIKTTKLQCLVGATAFVALIAVGCGQKKTQRRGDQGKKPQAAPLPKVDLPQITSRTNLWPAPDLAVTAHEIHLDGRLIVTLERGRIPAHLKRDGPDGYFITPLWAAMKKAAPVGRHKQQLRPGRLAGLMTLRIDRAHRNRLVGEILYTAHEAGFETFQLAGLRRGGGDLGNVIVRGYGFRKHPKEREAKGAVPSGSLVLRHFSRLSPRVPRSPVVEARLRAAFLDQARATTESQCKPTVVATGVDLKTGKPVVKLEPGSGKWEFPKRPASNATYRWQLICSLRASERIRKIDLSLRLRINLEGKVTDLAFSPGIDRPTRTCLLNEVKHWRFRRKTVPPGEYGLAVSVVTDEVCWSGRARLTQKSEMPPSAALRSVASQERRRISRLDLTLIATRKGYILRSALGRECPSPRAEGLCFLNAQPGFFAKETLHALQTHLHRLSQRKPIAGLPASGHSLIVVFERDTTYGDLLRTLDVAVEAPAVGRSTGRQTTPKASGCRLRPGGKQGAWEIDTAQTRQGACMFYDLWLSYL